MFKDKTGARVEAVKLSVSAGSNGEESQAGGHFRTATASDIAYVRAHTDTERAGTTE